MRIKPEHRMLGLPLHVLVNSLAPVLAAGDVGQL